MKKLILLLLISSASFAQIKIDSIKIGLPNKYASQISVRVLTFETGAKSCNTYYELKSLKGEILSGGNIHVDEIEFSNWNGDNCFIEDLVLSKLGLKRKK